MTQYTYSQEPVYFNKVFNKNGFDTQGYTIIDNGNEYVGYCSNWDISIPQQLVFFRLDYTGNFNTWIEFSEPGNEYFPGNVGGAMKILPDNGYCIAFHSNYDGVTYGRLLKLDIGLDTVWSRYYAPEYKNVIVNSFISNDGYLIVGWNWYNPNEFSDALLLRTDEEGNYLWHQTYGDEWAEHATNLIQTPDGGYLVGGFFWKPGLYHSLDAMVIKTDSLGNEEWTRYYGNPDVDDDMAFVALAGDGNYLVATVYGEYIWTPEARAGRIYILKIDENGEIIWDKKAGEIRYGYYMKNFREIGDNNYIANGWSEVIDSTIPFVYYPGWIYKFDQNGDSIWFRDYNHFNDLNDKNYIYDVSEASDNGFVGIGQSNEVFTQSNMWVIKLDSMGCDTPGCATGTEVFEWSVGMGSELKVWPNPTKGEFSVQCYEFCVQGEKIIRVYNSQGIKMEVMKVPDGADTCTFNAEGWTHGIYFLVVEFSGGVVGSAKIVVR
ncbi:MAG: hypothetical protein JW731_10380 [Bacteroidales bacterium]|nr:hypothetical protein [Bacteroidales bacterium]